MACRPPPGDAAEITFKTGASAHAMLGGSYVPEPAAMRIAFESPDQPDVRALIDALDAYQVPLYPAESHHGVDIAALCRPDVLFAVARDTAGRAVGCGALIIETGYGEIKRMYTDPSQRGKGVGSALLRRLEDEARQRGVTRFALETGNRQPQAVALYARLGYRTCGPFGPYEDDPHSVFMQKPAVAQADEAGVQDASCQPVASSKTL